MASSQLFPHIASRCIIGVNKPVIQVEYVSQVRRIGQDCFVQLLPSQRIGVGSLLYITGNAISLSRVKSRIGHGHARGVVR